MTEYWGDSFMGVVLHVIKSARKLLSAIRQGDNRAAHAYMLSLEAGLDLLEKRINDGDNVERMLEK